MKNKETSVEGKVLDMQEKDVIFSPLSSYAKKKEFEGTQFKIDSGNEVKEIEFPQTFSLTDKKNMRGELIRIIKNEHVLLGSCDAYSITQYELNILGGYLKGECLKTKTKEIMA